MDDLQAKHLLFEDRCYEDIVHKRAEQRHHNAQESEKCESADTKNQ